MTPGINTWAPNENMELSDMHTVIALLAHTAKKFEAGSFIHIPDASNHFLLPCW